jgi:putative ABC transport system permease protein
MTLSLAIRNLLRNIRRSLATLFAIAIGAVAMLLYGGYSKNIIYTLQTAYVASGGHLQVQHPDFFVHGSGSPTDYAIADCAAIIDLLRTDPVLRRMVEVVTPSLQFGGIAGNYAAGVSRTVIGTGLVASDYARMRRWNEMGVPPIYPPFGLDPSVPDAALLGIGLGRVLQLCDALGIPRCTAPSSKRAPAQAGAPVLPDDVAQLSRQEEPPAALAPPGRGRRIELLASSTRGSPNVMSVEATRAESQGFKELDDVYVLLHLAQAQRLVYGKEAPKVTAIMVQLKHTGQLPAAQARLQALLAEHFPGQPLAVLSFEALNPYYVQSIKMLDTIFGFMFILIGGIVLFTVANTMNTAVVERTIEIGTLRALGLRRDGIRRMFLVEGALLGALGAALGAGAAVLIASIVNRMGLTWVPPGIALDLSLTLRVWDETAMIATTSGGLALLATLSAWWPAYRAAKTSVVDALRHT